MRAYLGRRYRFSASHRLHSDAFTDAENQAIYGKCNNPYGHGHNYTIEVVVGGNVDPATGMVCDLVELDSCVQNEILDRFDHTNLNTQAFFPEDCADNGEFQYRSSPSAAGGIQTGRTDLDTRRRNIE